MIAVCLHNSSVSLSDHQRGRFASLDEDYYLTIGKEYIVLGMGIFESVLNLLVCDDSGVPSFTPAGAFDCATQGIPCDWHFAIRDGIRASGTALWEAPCVAMWGYDELVNDLSHAHELGERMPPALQIFSQELARRKLHVAE